LRIARKASLLVIFLTVFIDLVGFGIVLPMLPWYSKEFGASGLMAGCIVASYSLMQFIFAPMWGRLSDRIGRRPVLLISTTGACISYTVFALACGAGSIWLLLASRMAAGVCGANLSVASAYIADVSSPEDRSKRMGLIGMAFGLGFIFGPVLGALSAAWFGVTGPGWTAATICGLNLILAFFILGESRQPSSDPVPPAPRLAQYKAIMKRSQLGYLIGVFFLATFCFTCFESTFAVLFAGTKNKPGNFSYVTAIKVEADSTTHTPINWIATTGQDVNKGDLLARYFVGQKEVVVTAPISGRADLNTELSLINTSGKNPGLLGTIDTTKNYAYWLMAFCGIIGAIVQGACIGPLVKFCGEKWMIVAGLALVGVSLAVLPFCNDSRGLIFLMACLALFAVSSSIYRAPTFGLISLNASSAEQGQIMGVTQSIGSMARIIGPLFALSLMDLKLELPYLICALIAIIASVLAFLLIIAPSKEVVQPTETETKIDGDKSADNYAEETPKSPKRIQLPAKKDEPSAS
jgi:multidrug resistance protein